MLLTAWEFFVLCATVDTAGFVRVTDSTEPVCPSNHYVLLTMQEYSQTTLVVDPAEASTAFAWGFAAVVILGYFGSYPVGIVRSLLRKL